MKAVVFDAHGPLGNISVRELPDPTPAPGECLVRVRAVSLNGFDPMVLRGIPGLKTPLPMIPGADIAGEIVSLGAEVEGWRIGDRVTAIPNREDGMMGETLRGGACERIAIPAGYLLPIPEAVSFVDAACLPTAYGTALRMMETRGRVRAGERVLILGASGGVGTCSVQLAHAAGCEVIACASAGWKLEKLRALGADIVIDTSAQNYVEEVRARYGKPRVRGGGGVDVVVNFTGGDSWAECFRTAKRHARILTCGATAGYDPKTDLRYIWSFEFEILGCNGWTPDDQRELLARVADGRLTPAIHCVRPLEAFSQTLQELAERKVFGKAVLIP
jgi:alcohol dehydrogenase